MAYRNKTYVCFASEDIKSYNLMEAWRENKHIDFNFYDAHDTALVRDTSQRETVRRRLRERLSNTKQAVLLVGDKTRSVAASPERFLYYEMEVLLRLDIPMVIANLNQVRTAESERMPKVLADVYTMSTSFQPAIIKYALDDFPAKFTANLTAGEPKTGPYYYKQSVYDSLGI